MTEREMEDLLWEHPEKFLNEPLKQFQRQPASAVGRADVIFVDRIGRLLVIELKRDTLERGAVTQLVDYYGMMKSQFPDKSIELMVVANRIPPERRVACEQFDITAVEIPQKKFRDVAEEVGYLFKSEGGLPTPKLVRAAEPDLVPATPPGAASRFVDCDFAGPAKTEKGWYYWQGTHGREYFLAFVNAKGSCSMRRFSAEDGTFLGKEYKGGDYQDGFSEYVKAATPLYIARQPNLERDCRYRLPSAVLSELRRQKQAQPAKGR